ncbi:MAG: type VI secretion system protein TssA [Acidobacteriota bacterium]
MSGLIYYSDELLAPISVGQPCGQDLRHEREFSEILDARRSDDELNAGAWEKQEGRKLANWEKVAGLCLDALRTRTKDLRILCFLAEAALHQDGFAGLQQALKLCREILVEYWDRGLYPAIEDGDLDYRAAGLSWMNDIMPDVLRQVPITDQSGDNYSFVRYQQARRMAGTNRENQDELRRQGYIGMDVFDAAMNGTPRAKFEVLYAQFDLAEKALLALARSSDEKFGGDDGPSFQNAKECFTELRTILDPALRKKREEEPDKRTEDEIAANPNISAQPTSGSALWSDGLGVDQSQSWAEAEALIRSGNVDRGLAQMAALAASESSGRARFLRKLMLVDVCLGAKRERLAKTILEELKEQIIAYKLGQWESSALVGAVWSRLYRLSKKSDVSSEQEQAAVLYTQLCQLDPWQAYLHCED